MMHQDQKQTPIDIMWHGPVCTLQFATLVWRPLYLELV
jgi:hypothetical protein